MGNFRRGAPLVVFMERFSMYSVEVQYYTS